MRVLVTRPEPGAGQTASRLAAMGHEPVILPLSRIRRLDVATDTEAQEFDAVAASSANALRHAPAPLLLRLRSKPCHVVGRATAESARASGLAVGIVAEGAAELARELGEVLDPGARIAYFCGRVRLADFESTTRGAGLQAIPIETYDTNEVSYTTDKVLDCLARRPVDAVLLLSLHAANAFLKLSTDSVLDKYIGKAKIYCISRRVAAAFDGRWEQPLLTAGTPTEAALLELLKTKR